MADNDAKTICFDLDGTLCTNTWGDYASAEPFPWAIQRANELAAAGHRIVVFTARGTATGIDWSEVTRAQLDRWGLQYDDVKFGKPSAAVYVDDRAVHTTAWRRGSAWDVPGAGAAAAGPEWLPAAHAPQSAAVVEVGRTYDGRAADVEAHVGNARERARAAGVVTVPAADELRDRVLAELERFQARAGDDSVWSLAIFDGARAAHLDVWENGRVPAGVDVSIRPLSEAAAGLRRLLAGTEPGGPVAVAAATGAESQAWPIGTEDDRVYDALGGCLAACSDGLLSVQRGTGPAAHAERRLRELAGAIGVTVAEQPLDLATLRSAEEVLIAGEPFCVLAVGRLDGADLPGAAAGPVTQRLAGAWSESAGLDVAAQLAGLAQREVARL